MVSFQAPAPNICKGEKWLLTYHPHENLGENLGFHEEILKSKGLPYIQVVFCHTLKKDGKQLNCTK